jgi:2-oxoglutarate ferredoxin oxidoreductase subunit beta
MKTIAKRTPTLKDCPTHYCPGCGHGIAHRLVAEIIDELDIRDRTIGIAPVGCAVLAYDYLDVDMVEVAHGRPPAVATGMKRTNPDKIIFSYQGDGDLASIGAAEILHAGHRGEQITVIFINNAVYGMTGGQMAPTTMPGQVTTTCPFGRNPQHEGYPIRMVELLSTLRTPAFLARVAAHTPLQVIEAKGAIREAFRLQAEEVCFSMVEVLSICPTNWGLTVSEANKWLEQNMKPYYPLGVLKRPDTEGEERMSNREEGMAVSRSTG